MFYKGEVIDNVDPLGINRVKINIPELHENGNGIFCMDGISRYTEEIPEIGTMVWCYIFPNEPSTGLFFGYVKY